MKIKLLENIVCNGKPCKKGATVEVNDRDAKYLIVTGVAEEAAQKAASKTNPDTEK